MMTKQCVTNHAWQPTWAIIDQPMTAAWREEANDVYWRQRPWTKRIRQATTAWYQLTTISNNNILMLISQASQLAWNEWRKLVTTNDNNNNQQQLMMNEQY